MLNEFIANMSKVLNLNKSAILVYGSNVYESEKASDLDFCIIVENDLDIHLDEIVDVLKEFHLQFGLSLDYEVPYSNKLIYEVKELRKVITTKFPFYDEQGNYKITDTEKKIDFLQSEEMHYRLLLNILTTENKIFCNNEYLTTFIKDYSKKAKQVMYNAIVNFYKVDASDENVILPLFYSNPLTKKSGDEYLGYKKGNVHKEIFLRNWVRVCINEKRTRVNGK